MLCMFQIGALQNKYADIDSSNKIEVLKSYHKILNKIHSKTPQFIFTYHTISCFNCFVDIEKFFSQEFKKKYYIVIPSCKKSKNPVRINTKYAIYLFDPFTDCRDVSTFILPPQTQSNIYTSNNIVRSPSLFVWHKHNLFYFPYHFVFNKNGEINKNLFYSYFRNNHWH